MKGQDIFVLLFWLILAVIVLKRWQGANALLVNGGRVSMGIIKTLQG